MRPLILAILVVVLEVIIDFTLFSFSTLPAENLIHFRSFFQFNHSNI